MTAAVPFNVNYYNYCSSSSYCYYYYYYHHFILLDILCIIDLNLVKKNVINVVELNTRKALHT